MTKIRLFGYGNLITFKKAHFSTMINGNNYKNVNNAKLRQTFRVLMCSFYFYGVYDRHN